MANANFDKWLRLNKKPDESLRDAIYRFSDNTKNPRSAKEYLVDEYREEVNNEDYNKSVQEMPEQQQEGQPYAGKSEEIDPDTGEYDQYSLDDSPRRAIQQLKKTVGGSMSTLGFQDTGMEWSREANKRLSQIASPPTREEIEKEGGILGDIYGKLPEGFLGPGQLVEQSLPSLAPYTGSVAGMLALGPVGGFLGGYALSNLQVAGETHDRIIDDPIVKRELDISDVPYEDLTPTQQKKLKDFALDVSRSAGLRRMYTSGLIEAPALFVPAFNVNKLIPEFIKRQALDITFGSASEVLDEELYASNVANALMDKGMDEATGAMVKKEIRDMGPEAWEIFWGAFSQELTMGSAGTGAEILASRILGKNKDYRVDNTKTNQNELINTLTKEQEEKLPEYEKQAREDQDRQDKKDREDREEQVKLDNAQLDFAIKLDQLNLNREKAEQDRVKAEEERLDRMIEQEETFAKNLPKVLPLVEQQRIYARKKAALVKQGWDPKSIYMDNDGEARIKIDDNLEGLTEDDVRPDKVTGKPVPVTPDLTKPRAGEKIKVFNKDGEQVEVKVTKSQGPNVTVVGPRKKGPDGKFVKPVPSLLDTDTGQFFSNNPTEQVADEVAPVKKPLSEFSITELLNEESKLEKQAPTPQLKNQNVELQNIKTEIAKRDERMLNEEPAERVERLRDDGAVSYSETTPKVDPNQLNVPEPIRQANEIVEKLDAQEPASLSNPVLQKVLDGVVSKFNKLKIGKIKFEVADRNRAYEIKLNRLRKDYEKATGNQPQGTEDDIALQAQAKVNSTGLGAYVDNRPDKDGFQRIVLISDNIRGKTNEDVIRRAIQQTWHELFGHRALRDNFGGIDGKEYKDIIKEFDKNNGRDVDSWLKTSGETGGSGYVNEPRFRQVEEFIARNFAEYGISIQGKFRKLISSIREKLRAKGFTTIREQDLIAIFEKLQDEYIPNNRSIISGKPITKTGVQAQEEEDTQTAPTEEEQVSESRGRRPTDYDRFVSLGGKPPLKQYDRPKFDTARAPKKTAKDAERYVDASLLESLKKKEWPEQLVNDLANFDRYPKEFQEGFRKSLKSGLRESEKKLATAILSKGREAYLKKKKGNFTPDTKAPKGFEAQGARWKELVDDVPKWARTTPTIQRGMREFQEIYPKDQDISESVNTPEFKKWFGDSKAVDKKGRPKPFYHGTTKDKDFPAFKNLRDFGIWFTDNREDASEYGMDSPDYDSYGGKKNTSGRVIPAYLSYKNPYKMTRADALEVRDADEKGRLRTVQKKILLRAKNEGHDAVEFYSVNYLTDKMAQYATVVFDPKQIKSPFNKGTWSTDTPDISESATYFPDQKLKPIFPMPPKAFPGGYAEQKWANRLDPEDTPVYRKGGKFIDVSRGFPVKDSDPDMTNTIVPFGEIDTDFPGSRASFGVSGAVSKIKNLADNKPKKGQRKVNGKRISTGSAIMTNLLTKKFKFLDTNPNVKTNTENIATMENGAIVKYNKENDQSATKAGNFSDHLYAVQIVFDTDVQLFNTGKDKNQPSLRPRTYGDILVGDQVGTIQLDTGTVAPLYDRLIIVPPSKDEISYSFVGEVGVRQFITRNGMNPKGKMLTRDLNRQKKGSKQGAWFNPGLADGKWRVEVPNTGIKLKTMPFKYEGFRDTYDTMIDSSLPTRKQVFMGEDKKGKIKKQKTGESLPYMRLGDLLDLGALADYYPQLEDVYVHFADEFMGERMGYSSALQNPADNNPTGEGLSLTIGMAPPDPETMRNLDMDQMTMTTQGWIEDIHMKMMNDPNHDGVPHRLIASILHEVQHIIQAIEGFSSGGTLTEENITKDRIKNAIRNSTKGLWVSISPGKRLRIQKRFASTLNDLVNNDQKKAKDAVSKFGLKSPFVGKKWSDGSLFLDEDPTKTYQRWSKTTTISVTDLINDPNEASNRKFSELVSLPSKAMMQTIGSLSREKIISGKDAGKVHKLFENMLKPYTMNALGSMMGNQIPSGFAPDQMKRLMGQSDYFRLAGEVEARDVENRYLDAFRGNGRSGLPSLLNKRKQELVKRLSPSKPYLQGGTERGVVNIDESGTGTTPVNVPGEAVLGSPWRIEDMISYSMSDPLGDFAERVDIVTRARVAQINNLEKGTPERRNAIAKLHMNIMLNPIPVQDPTKPLPFQDELDSAVPFEDLSWSQRLPGHELSGVELTKKYMKNPEEWEKIRTEKGGYEKSGDTVEDIDTEENEGDDAGAGGRGKSAKITGLGLKGKVSLRQKKGETKEAYKERISRQAQKDYGALTKRAARLLYLGKIWTNWQMIRDMFGLNPGGRGRDAVPYLGHIISFMKMQREKLMRGEMTPRDIAKSVVMTLASQGADANNPWTVWNFTGGVKKAKPAKKGTKLANLTTYVEYMNGADWVKGTSKYLEANIGQKELNGKINENKVAQWYSKAPLWVVNVPWNGQGPSKGLRKKRGVNEYVEKFDTQYEAISDGVIYPKTVSWEEASTTPAYDSKGEPIEGRFQYSGGKPQFVKVGSDWMLQVDGKNYHGMGHYNSQLSHNRYENNILKVKIPELKTQIKKYQNDIKLNEKKLKDEFAGKKPEYTQKGELKAEYTAPRIEVAKKKIKEKTIPKIEGYIKKRETEIASLRKKIKESQGEADKSGKKKQLAEMPLWYRDPQNQIEPNEKTGALWVPQEYATTGGKPRMEDAVAYYFSTDEGQMLLDNIEKGEFDLKEWRKLANVRMAFGDDRLNQLLKPSQRDKDGNLVKVGLRDLAEYTKGFNEIVKKYVGDADPKSLQGDDKETVKLRLEMAAELGDYAQKLYGIAEAKQAFFKHFLGLGDAPTIDAIELNTHIAGSPATDLATSPLTGKPVANTWRVDLKWWSLNLQGKDISGIDGLGKKGKADDKTFFGHYRKVIQDAFDNIKRDVDARDPSIFEDVPPDYFYHVMHHWLWDVGKALTRADAVMGESTERFRPAAYEAMWRDANQQVLSYFRNDPIEATMVDWEPGHNQPDAVAEISEGDVELLEDISESVSLASMKGKLVQRSQSDRFATGFYVAKDQTSNIWPDTYQGKKGYWMRGGMGYPLLEDNRKARAAWAADDISIVKNVRDLQAMGADHVITVVGAPDMHFSNKAYFSIFWRETQDMVSKDPKKKQALINRIDSIMLNPTNKNLLPVVKALKEAQSQNPGKDSWELLKMVGPTLTFGDRKPIVVALGGAFGIKKPTTPIVAFPNNTLWEDTTVFKEVAVGTPVGIIKLDPMGNQKMSQRAKDLGIPPHEAYEFVFKGEVIGSWIGQQGGVPFDNKQFRQLFKDYEKRIIKKFQYKQGTFDISAGSKYMFGKAKLPFKIPGAEIKKLEKNWDSPAAPVSFSMVVNTLATDPRLQADFNNAQLKQAEWATSQSIFTRPLDQDKEIPGGRKLSGFVTRFMEPFGKLDMPQTLRDIRRRARGRILRVEEIGSRLYKALYKTQNQKEIYEYLSTKGGDPSTIPNLKERAAAKEVKAQIEKVGQQLVDRGLLNQAALDKYGDGYLPKVYLQYLLDDNDRYAIQRGLGSKVSNMDYLKKRGDIKEPIAKLVKGQVKDPAFLGSRAIMQPGRDIALLDMFEEIVVTSQDHGLNWVLPESLVKFSYLDEINKVAQQDSQLNYDLRDELANNESEKQEIESYIADLTKDIDKEREILRAKDRIQSKELNQMVKERNGMRDRLKMYKPKAMSGWALKAEAERIRTTIAPTFDVDSDDYSVVLKLAGRLEKLANDAIGSIIIPKDYMKIPDQARYGRLRGMIVQREIYDDLVGSMKMVEPDNVAEAIIGDSGLLGRANRLFKWSKVTANFPAAWVRNFSSNLVFMNVGGMNMARIPYYLTKATGEMIKTWKGQKSIYDDVKDLGLTGSTFAAVELGRIEKEYENFLNRVERKQKKSPWRAFFMAKEFLTMAQDWTSDKYGLVDSLGKTMMYMNGIDKGMSPSQAADEAEKWLFDYSLVKPSVKKLRNAVVGAPFLTYTTKVFPLLVETALTKPWRFAPYIALPYAMAALFKDNHDLDDEEYEALMYSLPEYLREKRYAGNIMPLPYLDENGRAQFLDLAYLYPWGMFTEIASEAQDNPGDIIQTLGLLGGPTASLITVISSGVDPFTRRPVSNKLDSNTQQWVDKMKYVYNLMMPPFLHTDYGALSRLRQTMNGELNRYGEPMKTLKQGLSQTLGFNVSPIDPTSQRAKNARYLQSEILKTQGFARRELTGMALSGKSSMEIREKSQYFKDLIKERQNQLKEYLKKSKFPSQKLKEN